MDISKGFTIAQFQQNILKKTGGISASNLYAFQISNPDETKGILLADWRNDQAPATWYAALAIYPEETPSESSGGGGKSTD